MSTSPTEMKMFAPVSPDPQKEEEEAEQFRRDKRDVILLPDVSQTILGLVDNTEIILDAINLRGNFVLHILQIFTFRVMSIRLLHRSWLHSLNPMFM